eukprot:CAMPEP_0171091054 /NCGR_PEP_ID=MMETSP0766_2-20121228/32210_1 /TAXON_ID=439317 /ORGANISM="Gambierdiscus australes, Strain CAWD 149" /LENGTH=216 /DNA_ID=CAMNT_0011549111 /DNA_START=38 /DNA_END=685 /DNA_ORIENTATION=-
MPPSVVTPSFSAIVTALGELGVRRHADEQVSPLEMLRLLESLLLLLARLEKGKEVLPCVNGLVFCNGLAQAEHCNEAADYVLKRVAALLEGLVKQQNIPCWWVLLVLVDQPTKCIAITRLIQGLRQARRVCRGLHGQRGQRGCTSCGRPRQLKVPRSHACKGVCQVPPNNAEADRDGTGQTQLEECIVGCLPHCAGTSASQHSGHRSFPTTQKTVL